MNGTDTSWLAEFTATLLFTHAVEALRAIIPDRESITGLRIEVEGGKLLASYDDPSIRTVNDMEFVALSEQQEAAARLLLATVNYQCVLIEKYLHVPLPTPKSPEELEELRAKSRADLAALLRGEDGEPNAEADTYARLEEELRQKLKCRSGEIGLPKPALIIER